MWRKGPRVKEQSLLQKLEKARNRIPQSFQREDSLAEAYILVQ